jgi:hypothetical protein
MSQRQQQEYKWINEWNSKVYYGFRKNTPTVPAKRWMNPVHREAVCFFKNQFSIILQIYVFEDVFSRGLLPNIS